MFAKISHVSARLVVGVSAVLFSLTLFSGCGDTYPTDLKYGVRTDVIITKRPVENPTSMGAPGKWPYLLPGYKGEKLDPAKLTAGQKDQFAKTLDSLFGTPAAPMVATLDGVDTKSLESLRVDKETLAAGSKLYRRHCLHCHGLTGDGHGPTASWVNPHPRDYRLGKFKFTSSGGNFNTRKPRREDLLRVLRQGIEGTSMPSFGLLPEVEQGQLVSYVIHLSLRGQSELDALIELMEDTDFAKGSTKDIDKTVKDGFKRAVVDWGDAESVLIQPKTSPKVLPGTARTDEEKELLAQSIDRGYKVFLGATGGTSCISCHKDYGRAPNLLWDDWGTVVRPSDLTTGIYRGGRRPIDLFWRVHGGIPGSNMAPFPNIDNAEVDMWHVVNFVLALPYPDKLPKEIRDQIYPTPSAPKTQLTSR